MNIKKILTTGAAAAILFGNVVNPAFAAAFANGSFETGTNPGGFLVVNSGSSDISSWDVTSGSVDYIGSYWTAADGSRSIDLSGNEAGTISQTFDTEIGATYTVSFALSGNPAGGPTVKTLNVSATGGAITPYSYDTLAQGTTLGDMKWTSEEYVFVASSASTTLTFASTTAGFFGPALDKVMITKDFNPGIDVPEQCNQNITYNVINGTNGSEVINGTSGPDLIFAMGGSDVVNGKAGDDCIVGGDGSDALHGQNGNDVILGGTGSDAIMGDAGNDKLYGQDGSDSVKGGAGDDDLWGGAGSDSLKGDSGTDTADGGINSDACSAETTVQCP